MENTNAQYEDCYNLQLLENGAYLGTIKVPKGSNTDICVNRVEVVLPYIAKRGLKVNKDYTLNFVCSVKNY